MILSSNVRGFLTFALYLVLSLNARNSCYALTVDNQLVSARNDCFERVALEAMLPFQKAFSTEDTNSLKMCKEKCLQVGDKCQSISFGVHRRGNGTCQLSTEKFDLSTGARPSGVIFDPDFDLYARKSNCFDLSDNTIPLADGLAGGDGGGGGGGYSVMSPTTSINYPTRPLAETTPVLVMSPTPTTVTTFDDRPLSTTVAGGYGTTTLNHYSPEGPSSTLGPTPHDGDRLYFSHDIYPLYKYPTLYEHNYPAPNEDVYIPGGYASNVPQVDDRYRPPYSYDDSARPTPHEPPRPVFGLGYGTGYSYGKPEQYNPTTPRPYEQSSRPYDHGSRPYDHSSRPYDPNLRPYDSNTRPYDSSSPSYDQSSRPYEQSDRDRPGYTTRPDPYPNDRPMGPSTNGGRPTRPDDFSSTTPYYPRPDYGPNRPPPPPPPEIRPTTDYLNRPDPLPPNAYDSGGSSMRPPIHDTSLAPGPGMGGYGGGQSDPNRYDSVRRNGTAARPDFYNDDKTIATYFNPEDYLPNKRRPGGYGERDSVTGNPMKKHKAQKTRTNGMTKLFCGN